MGNEETYKAIIDKLGRREKFGLYGVDNSCYFEDGTKVHYHDLWMAIKLLYNLDASHHKTLSELCPDSFIGTFPDKFHQNKLKRKILAAIGGKHS